ncbi:MAG: hypothetical protein JWN76_909, partial [Chitinophagaceae bacterium]|nr:hypothetical protein [Chitinophagaceae bacterium]
MKRIPSLVILLLFFSFIQAQTTRYIKPASSGSGDGSSWANASASLQAIITASASGDQVWVAAGTYTPSSNASFSMKTGVSIYGGFLGTETLLSQRNWSTNVTILQGNGASVIINSSISSTALLDGFTIKGGTAAGTTLSAKGGGMTNSSSSPTIVNCIFKSNTTTGGFGPGATGGGGAINNSNSSPIITNCIFLNNNATGTGGAMANYGSSNPAITNCSFYGNTASVAKCLYQSGAAIPVLANCILWDGGGSEIANNFGNNPSINYSDVQGGWGLGTGNINADPLFADAANGNLKLSAGSPAINTGNSASVPGGVTVDLANTTRITGSSVDMGAYEYVPVGTTLNFDGTNDYVAVSNPFKAYNKEITVEFWMNPASSSLPFGSIIGQGVEGQDNMTNTVWLMHPNNDGTGTFYVNDAGTFRTVTFNITASSWHHIAGVAGPFGTKVYVDGVLAASGAGITGTILNNASSVIHIGKDVRYAAGRFADISLDEVRIWSRALCQDEIVNNKNCGPDPSVQTGLQEYYRFNQGVENGSNAGATTLTDGSGNGRDGTLNNFALTGSTSNWTTSGSTNTGTCAAYVAPTAAITGTTSICLGSGSTLSNANAGGVWTSSNTGVATIDASTGVLASVSAGTTTITYKTECGAVSIATVTVNALPTLLPATASICVGANTTLTGSGTPAVSNAWTSSSTPIATVNNSGVVTGVAGGTATITYKETSGCTATSAITVKSVLSFGNALNFSHNEIAGTNANLPQGNNSRTIEAWIKYSTGDDMTIFQYGQKGTATNQQFVLHLYHGVYIIGLFNDIQTNFTVNDNAWHHLAVTHDGTTTKVYVDGSQIASVARNYNTNGTGFQIGFSDRTTSKGFYYTGNMDEVRVWSVARTQAEIQAAMNSALNGNETGLVAYYNFNQGSAGGTNTGVTTLNDKLSSAHDGVLATFPLTGTTGNWILGNNNVVTAISGNTSLCTGSTTTMTNATPAGAWSSSNLPIATINGSGLVTGITAGIDTLFYTVSATSYCTNVASFILTVKQPTSSTTNVSVCASTLPYAWNGNNYNAAGTYNVHLTNSVGCDSSATLVLTTKQATSSTVNVSVCASTLPYAWNGNNYNAAGTYNVHLTNSVGCDSSATLILTTKQATSSTTNVSVCAGTLPYAWNGNNYNAPGTYTKTFAGGNAAGCDSVATLILNVTTTIISTTNVNICASALPYSWNGNSYVSPGNYIKTFPGGSVGGCDSVANLVLTVRQISASTTNVSICASSLPYVWNGKNYNAAGIYNVQLTNAVGCDSTASLILSIKQATNSTTNVSVCAASLPYIWNGNNYNAAGTYNIHLTNAAGCDSTATLILSIKQATNSNTNVSVCAVSLPYVWNGNNYNAAGTYNVHLTNSVGCDSSATLVLTTKQATNSTTNVSVCASSLPYVWNGNNYTTAGTYNVHLTNSVGCDSSATLVLTTKQATSSTTNVSVCASTLPYVWNGNNYNATGTYNVHLINAIGCDSTATLALSVNANPIIPTISNSRPLSFCTNDSAVLVSSSPGNNQWLLNGNIIPGAVSLQYVTNISGNYTVQVANASGCSATSASVTTTNRSTIGTGLGTHDTLICKATSIKITASANLSATYSWTAVKTGFTSTLSQVNLSAADLYKVRITLSNGCTVIDSINVRNTADTAIKARLSVSGHAFINQTLVLVNVTSPAPQSQNWALPAGATVMLSTDSVVMMKFASAGNYMVYLKNKSYNVCASTDSAKIVITTNDSLNVVAAIPVVVRNITIAPNPTTGIMNVGIELNQLGKTSLRIYDLYGTLAYSKNITPVTAKFTEKVDISAAPSNQTYLLVIQTKDGY